MAERSMAVTVDDLPWFGQLAPGDSAAAANERLLSAFDERDIHATGFVVCANVDPDDPVIRAWLGRGMALGNHTAHHLDLHQTPPEQWAADVRACHDLLARMVPGGVKYFRYPMLHQGMSQEQRTTAAAVLATLGYGTAHVTVDNSEWLLAEAYGRALSANDTTLRDRIAEAYIEHIMAAVRHFDEVGRAELGRTPPHVLLLHANALAADHAGELLDTLKESGIRIAPLEEVLADPVFSLEDTYSGPKGLSWLYRARPHAFERWGAWDDAEAERVRAAFPSKTDE